jgi:hypothetical protein
VESVEMVFVEIEEVVNVAEAMYEMVEEVHCSLAVEKVEQTCEFAIFEAPTRHR